jgi:transposase
MISDCEFIDFVKLALKLCKNTPKYNSKFSKKTYNNHQKMVILLLKQKTGLSYDLLIDDLKTRTLVLEMLELTKVPDPSTIKKFANKISFKTIGWFLKNCINLTRKKKVKTAVDSTGFKVNDGSCHYRKRLGLPTTVKKYLKASAIVDTDLQLVLAATFRKNQRHDIIDFKPLVKRVNEIKQILIVTADKGYDSEEIRRFVIEEIGAECQIAIKGEIGKHAGFYRKRFVLVEVKYHKRSLVETVFSVIKRVFGEVIRAKQWFMQKKELMLRCITYNLYRIAKIMRMSR